MKKSFALAGITAFLACGAVKADITVGVSLGITGPGASLGVHYRNAYQLMPPRMPVNWSRKIRSTC